MERHCLGPVRDVCGHGRQLFTPQPDPALFRSFLRRVTMAPRKLSAATLRAARAASDPCKENRIQVSGVDTLASAHPRSLSRRGVRAPVASTSQGKDAEDSIGPRLDRRGRPHRTAMHRACPAGCLARRGGGAGRGGHAGPHVQGDRYSERQVDSSAETMKKTALESRAARFEFATRGAKMPP